jgi:hypothetical protein
VPETRRNDVLQSGVFRPISEVAWIQRCFQKHPFGASLRVSLWRAAWMRKVAVMLPCQLPSARARTLGIAMPRRSTYDRVVVRLYKVMKRNREFHEQCSEDRRQFDSGTRGVVFTYTVAHAVRADRFTLEQSFFGPREALLAPDAAPLEIVDRIAATQ